MTPEALAKDPAPPYETHGEVPAGISQATTVGPSQFGLEIHDGAPRTIMKSAKYPRVAVLLGVNKYYYIPLLVCRLFSTIFTLLWTAQAGLQLYRLSQIQNGTPQEHPAGEDSIMVHRLRVTQVALSFLWAIEAAYLSHLFASSLMSRWLLQYSPAAVLIRLCGLSCTLAYGCMQIFNFTGALAPDLEKLSRCLPIWISTCVCLLISYFSTQQDISIEQDRDNRKRRLVLRLKCLYTTAACSLVSVFALVVFIQLGSKRVQDVKQDVLLWVRAQLQLVTEVIDVMVTKEEL